MVSFYIDTILETVDGTFLQRNKTTMDKKKCGQLWFGGKMNGQILSHTRNL